mmetsp:Transcript_16354/g.51175  ORF Transcript_16354/g.51175 Transcript_16354/m.51175 type:complete len:240 (-) Transcript_16354:72-791(-)
MSDIDSAEDAEETEHLVDSESEREKVPSHVAIDGRKKVSEPQGSTGASLLLSDSDSSDGGRVRESGSEKDKHRSRRVKGGRRRHKQYGERAAESEVDSAEEAEVTETATLSSSLRPTRGKERERANESTRLDRVARQRAAVRDADGDADRQESGRHSDDSSKGTWSSSASSSLPSSTRDSAKRPGGLSGLSSSLAGLSLGKSDDVTSDDVARGKKKGNMGLSEAINLLQSEVEREETRE